MALLPIFLANQPVLRETASPVEAVDDYIRILLNDMLETMYASDGLGLAAPQIGISKRVIVVDCAPEGKEPIKMVNPEITWKSDTTQTRNEGCLSIPGAYGNVTRHAVIALNYLDCNGNSRQLEAGGLLSTVIQHEIDHLNGVLFMDHLSRQQCRAIMRKINKYPS